MNQNNNSLNNIFKSGMFTSTPQKDTTPSPFGTTQNSQSVFGSTPQQPFGSSNIFGSTSGIQQSQNHTQNNTQNNTQNPFGQQSSTGFQTPLYQKPQGGVFGALGSSGTVQPLNTPQTSNTFGSSTFGGNAFGNTTTPAFGNTTTPAFGNTTTPAFGSNTTPAFRSNTTPAFGTTTTPAFGSNTTASGFGSNTTTPAFGTTGWNTPSSSIFGSTKPSTTTPSFGSGSLSIGSLKSGSRDTPYQDTRVKDGIGSIDIKHINAMNEYSRKSNDEVRQEDYNLGRKAITSGTQSSSSLFGTTPQASYPQPFFPNSSGTVQQTTPTFGTSSTPFGTSSTPFGASSTPTFGTSSTPFGTSSTPTFGTSSGSAPVGTPSTSFGAPPSFGTPSTSFGTPSTSFGTPSTSFGTPPSTFGTPSSSQVNQPAPPSVQNPPFGNQSTNNTFMQNTTFFDSSMISPKPVDYEDPFLLKDIKFERVEKKMNTFSRVVPKPIFSENTKKPLLNLTYRPPRINQKRKIYTEPSIEEARHLREIENLVIGFDGKGRIQYLDKICGIEVTTSNIEDKISFMKKEVIVSDPPGVGFNKRARVYVEGVFAFSKSMGDFIVGKADKYPLKAIQERFVYSLKDDPYKKFIDYNYETGLYVYEVNHF